MTQPLHRQSGFAGASRTCVVFAPPNRLARCDVAEALITRQVISDRLVATGVMLA